MRIIVTFPSLHRVLAAEKSLKSAAGEAFQIRPTPTPPGLSSAICGMSIEILSAEQEQEIARY